MPHQVSGFNPQTWALALKCEHWYKISWKNCFPSGIPSPKCVNCVPHREIANRWNAEGGGVRWLSRLYPYMAGFRESVKTGGGHNRLCCQAKPILGGLRSGQIYY